VYGKIPPCVPAEYQNLTDAEAEAIDAKDRESHQRDLHESIERGDRADFFLMVTRVFSLCVSKGL